MPPKNAGKGGNQTSKKTEQKKKEKVVEDKTFGLKNKKGTKQQKFIQQVQKQVTHGGNKSARQLEKEKEEGKNKKDLKKKEILEINNLFKPVQQQVAKGVDPKSILCAFFKQGQCGKGNKCKFSHDLNIERKSEKRSAYFDARDENETSENWDEEMLKEVVEKKHGKECIAPSTQIICRYFLDAVELGKYGWFWECPTGNKCIYRHALPPGYILKKDRKKMDKNKEEISLEDLIERERAALGIETTKVTLETFLAWKKKKLKEKDEQEKKDTDKKKSDYKSGREGGISGREMFIFNPDLAVGEDMEEGDGDFDLSNMKKEPGEGDEEEEEEMEIHYKEIDLNSIMSEYKDVNSTENNVSIAKPDRLESLRTSLATEDGPSRGLLNGDAAGSSKCEGAVAIDEDLFGGDDEDLDDLEEQLEEMAVTS